jgi:hypothetical protein
MFAVSPSRHEVGQDPNSLQGTRGGPLCSMTLLRQQVAGRDGQPLTCEPSSPCLQISCNARFTAAKCGPTEGVTPGTGPICERLLTVTAPFTPVALSARCM